MNWDKFTQADLEAMIPLPIFERGKIYFEEGHLLHCCRLDNLLAGVLIGTGGKYEVRIWLDESGLAGECSCPYNGFCKHMTALAYGWLKDGSRFINLAPSIETIINDTRKLTTIFLNLVQKEPFSFLELISTKQNQDQFISTRGIINLIRNTFSVPYLTLTGVDNIWEKLINLRDLIVTKLNVETPETPELVLELLAGLESVPDNCRNETWVQFLQEFLEQIKEVSIGFPPKYLQPVKEKLLSMYFNPGLWDFSAEIRNILIKFDENNLEALSEQINCKLNSDSPILTLILIHELLAEIPITIGEVKIQFDKVKQNLATTPDGLLWLIDRLIEQDSEQAFRLAKQGFRTFPADKRSFRERQINIHIKRDELKQAAALSFIQFQEQPNFEEYLRLKELLAKHPNDWASYLKRLEEHLKIQKNEQLLIKVIITEGNIKAIGDYLDQIINNSDLLFSIAQLLETTNSSEVLPVYPLVIKALLAGGLPGYWKVALRLLTVLKKQSQQQNRIGEWEEVCRELQMEYRENRSFQKKFGSILAI